MQPAELYLKKSPSMSSEFLQDSLAVLAKAEILCVRQFAKVYFWRVEQCGVSQAKWSSLKTKTEIVVSVKY